MVLLNVYMDVEVTCEKVIDEMAKYPRQMDFIL